MEYFISEDSVEYANELEERDYYTQDNVFWAPQEARREALRAKAKRADIGSIIDKFCSGHSVGLLFKERKSNGQFAF